MIRAFKASGLILLIGLMACKSTKEPQSKTPVASTDSKPSWVTQRPVSSSYYIGIGMAMKKFSPAEYPNIAKKNALSDLSSEIKVSVAGNSVLQQFEDNDEFRETFSNNTRLMIKQDLEDFEMAGAWESNEEFWVYYRLSKATYKEIKARRIKTAIEKAKVYVEKGDEKARTGESISALESYFQAFLEIERFLEEDLSTELDGRKVFFGTALQERIEKGLRNINIKAMYQGDVSALNTYWGQSIGANEIAFSLSNSKGKALTGVELKFESSRFRPNPTKASTNQQGQAGTSIKLSKGISRVEVTAQPVLNDFSDKVLRAFIKKLRVPQAVFLIDVRSPKISVASTEKEFGNAQRSPLSNAFKAAMSNEGFISDEQNPDYKAVIEVDTRKAGVNKEFHTAYLNGEISIIKSKTNELMFKYNFSDVKGVGLDWKSASNAAYQEAESELKRKAVWQFMQSLP